MKFRHTRQVLDEALQLKLRETDGPVALNVPGEHHALLMSEVSRGWPEDLNLLELSGKPRPGTTDKARIRLG